MSKTFRILIAILIFSSIALVGWHKPGHEKPVDEFYGTLNCKITKEGTEIDQEGFIYFADREEVCTLSSADEHVAGTITMMYFPPWAKKLGQAHSYWIHLHLDAGSIHWVGYAWGTVTKDGEHTLRNGWMWTPEESWYYRHMAWLRFEMPALYGSYETRGD